jgi:hypothetical protein
MSEGVVLSEPVRHWNGEPPTRSQVLEELARELAKRRAVYPRWVAKKVITQKAANERIDRLQAAYDYIVEQWPVTPKR